MIKIEAKDYYEIQVVNGDYLILKKEGGELKIYLKEEPDIVIVL